MKKTLYIMRHGQTLFNLQHKIQGWCDAPLTTLGIQQAQVARDYFVKHNVHFDAAYSSTSERACDTLEIVTDYKMPYTRKKGLKEWNFGSFEGKDDYLNPKLPYGDFFKAYGGEGEKEFQNRVSTTIKKIADQEEHETILIVCHGAALAQFAKKWDEYGLVKHKPGIGNCAIYQYEYENNVFTCVDIVKHDFSHLQ